MTMTMTIKTTIKEALSLTKRTSPLNIGIAGGLGRMGRLLTQEVLGHPREVSLSCVSARDPHELTSLLPPACTATLTNSPEVLVDAAEIILDFTTPELSLSHARYAAAHGKKLLIGTTGFTEDQHIKIKEASCSTVLLLASNTSLGIGVLSHFAPLFQKALGPHFDLSLREAHHRGKKDAPSGTALTLASKLSGIKSKDSSSKETTVGPPCPREVDICVTRAGGLIGDHEISFVSEDEMITLSHRALNRTLFATGALKAALWMSQKETPGLYTMEDVLFSDSSSL